MHPPSNAPDSQESTHRNAATFCMLLCPFASQGVPPPLLVLTGNSYHLGATTHTCTCTWTHTCTHNPLHISWPPFLLLYIHSSNNLCCAGLLFLLLILTECQFIEVCHVTWIPVGSGASRGSLNIPCRGTLPFTFRTTPGSSSKTVAVARHLFQIAWLQSKSREPLLCCGEAPYKT